MDANSRNRRQMIETLVDRLRRSRTYGKGERVEMREAEISRILQWAKDQFTQEPTLLELNGPITVVGDIHGQFDDLNRIFKFCGSPRSTNAYLFIGDYVDRGPLSLETITLLLCYKLLLPTKFYMTRGNHETSSINRAYGFFDDCRKRFSVKLWHQFQNCFNNLPVAAVIGGRILCLHGGLSPRLSSISQINTDIQRPTEIPDTDGLLLDLMWSDPKMNLKGFAPSGRGISVYFGEDVVDHFCATTGIELIVRAHQVVDQGYAFFARHKVLTIFSAPNYMKAFQNDAGILTVKADLTCKLHVLSLHGPNEDEEEKAE